MKFTLTADALADAAAFASKGISARPPVPVLSGLLIEAQTGGLRISGFDYEKSARTQVAADVSDPGTVLLQGKMFTDIIRKFGRKTVTVTVDERNATLQAGTAEFSMRPMQVDEFPPMPDLPAIVGTIDGTTLAAAVGQVIGAASADDSVPILKGVHITSIGSDLTLRTTDRYRLAEVTIPWQPAGDDVDILVRGSWLADTVKTLAGEASIIKWAPDCPKCGNMCSVYRHEDDSPYYWCGLCGVDWDISIRLDDPDADIIPEPADIHSGGTPCQDLSAAGRRAGMNEGTRSNLWVNMREAIAIQRPKYVVWENVRGAFSACASSEMGQCPGCVDGRGPHKPFLRALGRVLGDLSDLGYDTQWRGLRAADVGACHGRFRVFVLARRSDARDADLTHVEGGGAAGWADSDSEQSPRPYRSTSDGYRTQGSSDSDSCTRGRGPDTGNTGGGTAEVQDPAHADSVGHERPRDARGRWTRLADGGQPLADTEGIGRGEGRAESAGIERGLPAARDSASAPDASCITIRQHPGEPSAEEAGPPSCDGSCDSCGERDARNERQATPDTSSDGRLRRPDLEGEGRTEGVRGEALGHLGDSDPSRPNASVCECCGITDDDGDNCLAGRHWHCGICVSRGHDIDCVVCETAADADRRDDAGRLGDAKRRQEWGEVTAGRGEGSGTTTDTPSPRRAEGQDGGASSSDEGAGSRSGEPERIDGERSSTNWGDYEPAIRRWERTIGRTAPRPTEPTGRHNGHRLSPRFTEWMMGLPDGWVTDPAIGISRNEQLKACGNGVVPQQAYAALSNMLAAFKAATPSIETLEA